VVICRIISSTLSRVRTDALVSIFALQELAKRLFTALSKHGSRSLLRVAEETLLKIFSGPSGRGTIVRALRCLPEDIQLTTLSKSLSIPDTALTTWSYRHWDRLPYVLVFGAASCKSLDEFIVAFGCTCQPLMFLSALQAQHWSLVEKLMACRDRAELFGTFDEQPLKRLSTDYFVCNAPMLAIRIAVASLGWSAEWVVRKEGRYKQMEMVCQGIAWQLTVPSTVNAPVDPPRHCQTLLGPRTKARCTFPSLSRLLTEFSICLLCVFRVDH
jgi:hypothetical protein